MRVLALMTSPPPPSQFFTRPKQKEEDQHGGHHEQENFKRAEIHGVGGKMGKSGKKKGIGRARVLPPSVKMETPNPLDSFGLNYEGSRHSILRQVSVSSLPLNPVSP